MNHVLSQLEAQALTRRCRAVKRTLDELNLVQSGGDFSGGQSAANGFGEEQHRDPYAGFSIGPSVVRNEEQEGVFDQIQEMLTDVARSRITLLRIEELSTLLAVIAHAAVRQWKVAIRAFLQVLAAVAAQAAKCHDAILQTIEWQGGEPPPLRLRHAQLITARFRADA